MRVIFILALVFLASVHLHAQNDTIFFNNGDMMVGEILSLGRGVLTVETDYSDSDFMIEWSGIRQIKTENTFFIMITNAGSLYGQLESVSDSTIRVTTQEGFVQTYNKDDIVLINPIDKKFRDRFSASIDIGLSITKANNLQQLTSRSNLGYKAERWNAEASFNTLQSVQDEGDSIRRSDGRIIGRLLFSKHWFVSLSTSILSNTEQKLDWRNNTKVGIGRYIIHTNRSYWSVRVGMNRNTERFSNETPDRNSWEGNIGSELDLFDIGDLSLLSSIMVYPSITEEDRWRIDGLFDLKYDLPLDFYVKAGITVNYDNQPATDASDTDYVLQTGFGWEW